MARESWARRGRGSACRYFLFGALWDRALPAAVLLSLPVRPSFRTLEAADAAVLPVFRLRGMLCSSLK